MLFIKTVPDRTHITTTIENSILGGLPHFAMHEYKGESSAAVAGWTTQRCCSPRNPTEKLHLLSKKFVDNGDDSNKKFEAMKAELEPSTKLMREVIAAEAIKVDVARDMWRYQFSPCQPGHQVDLAEVACQLAGWLHLCTVHAWRQRLSQTHQRTRGGSRLPQHKLSLDSFAFSRCAPSSRCTASAETTRTLCNQLVCLYPSLPDFFFITCGSPLASPSLESKNWRTVALTKAVGGVTH